MEDNKSRTRFPLFIDLWDKQVVVIGGGTIALRRVRTLIEFTDRIKVVAPEFDEQLRVLAQGNGLWISDKRYDSSDLNGAFLVLAATDDRGVNRQVYDDCKTRGIIVNVSSDRELCDFYFPAVIKEDNLVIGLAADGTDHARVKSAARSIRAIADSL